MDVRGDQREWRSEGGVGATCEVPVRRAVEQSDEALAEGLHVKGLGPRNVQVDVRLSLRREEGGACSLQDCDGS